MSDVVDVTFEGPLRIESDGTPKGTRLYVGGKEVKGIVEMTFHSEVDDLAELSLRLKLACWT